jgi:trehalose 6-phosphate synthase
MNFDEENWLAYRQANLQFAEVVRHQLTPGAMVWVQDYHLMLLPMFLRGIVNGRKTLLGASVGQGLSMDTDDVEVDGLSSDHPPIAGVKIGFFLHTPFPSSEIYRYDYSPQSSLFS